MENEGLSTEKHRLSDEEKKENYIVKPDGRLAFKEGNIIGRFPKKLTLVHLTKLIQKDEKLNPDKKTLLKHYKDRLFKNDNLLAKFMDKYLPTKTINELTGADGSPLNITYKEIIYEPPKE